MGPTSDTKQTAGNYDAIMLRYISCECIIRQIQIPKHSVLRADAACSAV